MPPQWGEQIPVPGCNKTRMRGHPPTGTPKHLIEKNEDDARPMDMTDRLMRATRCVASRAMCPRTAAIPVLLSPKTVAALRGPLYDTKNKSRRN